MSDWNTTEGWNSGFSGAASGAEAGFSVGGPIGAVVGGLGGLVGGLFGKKKKGTDWNKKNFEESVRQFNVQDDYNKNLMQYRVKDALKAGINPVAAVGGASGSYSPTISAGGSGYESSQDSNFVENAGRIASLFGKQQRQDRAIALESANLDLESKRLQNQILRQQLLSETQPGIVSSRGDVPKNSTWRIPMDYRLRDVGDLYLPWKDRSGNVHWFLNPDAIADADWSNIEADRALLAGVRDLSYDYVPRKGSYFKRKWPAFRRYVRSAVGVR